MATIGNTTYTMVTETFELTLANGEHAIVRACAHDVAAAITLVNTVFDRYQNQDVINVCHINSYDGGPA